MNFEYEPYNCAIKRGVRFEGEVMKVIVLSAVALVVTVAPLMAGSDPVVSMPDKDWRLSVDWSGFEEVEENGWSDPGARKWYFRHENGRYSLSVVIKPAQAGVSAEIYRDDRWGRLQSKAPTEEAARLWTEATRAFFEYFLESEFQGRPLHQKHIHTFLLHDDSRIEIHVSALHFREKDQEWLDGFQPSIQVVGKGDEKSN